MDIIIENKLILYIYDDQEIYDMFMTNKNSHIRGNQLRPRS
tara:strand:+ start:760 stop:882 length:123 start_codon:yes stop_codon:yes gene_type:complete